MIVREWDALRKLDNHLGSDVLAAPMVTNHLDRE